MDLNFARAVAFLITVVVLEENRNGRLTQELAEVLQKVAVVAMATRQGLFFSGEEPSLLLYRWEDAERIQAPRPIVVLSADLTQCPSLELPSDARVLLSSQNRHGADFVSKVHLPILDCGFSLRDSLTLSSHNELDAVVTLQRSIEDLWGRPVDPVDLPLTLSRELSPHILLYSAGICLLAGWADRLGNEKI